MRAVLAIDGSRESEIALDTTASLVWPPGSYLDVITVVPTDAELVGGPWVTPSAALPDARDRLHVDRRRLVDEAAALVRRPGLSVIGRVLQGRAASTIAEHARQSGAGLVIVGARGHGTLERALLGSVSAEVMEHAPCPVLVARRTTAWRLLLGTDGLPDAELAVRLVAESGIFRYATARILNVIDVPAATWLGFGDTAETINAAAAVAAEMRAHGSQVAQEAARRVRSAGIEADCAVSQGPAAAAIIDHATTWAADLIIVGSRGHGLIRRLIVGSTARTVALHAPMSVLIVRPTPAVPEPPRGRAARVRRIPVPA